MGDLFLSSFYITIKTTLSGFHFFPVIVEGLSFLVSLFDDDSKLPSFFVSY